MASVALQPVPPSMSFFRRLVGIYIRPRRTFEDIVSKPDFWLPVIAVVLMNLLVVWAAIARFGFDRLAVLTFTWGYPGADYTDLGAAFVPIRIAYLHHRAILVPGLLILFAAVGGVAIPKLFFKKEIHFKKALAVAAYAYLVNISGAILAVGVIFLGDPERYKPLAPAPTNLSFFMNPARTPVWMIQSLLGLDICLLWFIGLFGIGISAATRWKVKARWIVLSLVCLFFVLYFMHMAPGIGEERGFISR